MSVIVHDTATFPARSPAVLEELKALQTLLAQVSAELAGPDGAPLALPEPVYELLRETVQAMSGGPGITARAHNSVLTSQEAAKLLGVSRTTLRRLLNRGEIPHDRVGRRCYIRLVDLIAHQQRVRGAVTAAAARRAPR